ncbi:MAG TPA: (Fe-S)-binding protein [Candidatus Nanopelagicaceae bacterium]|nr:(Fe-S)-binding protein [Candidatus Nanopelagicaceae bacterium]
MLVATTISYGITAVALIILVVGIRRMLATIRLGQPDPFRTNSPAQRFRTLIREVLGHTRMRQWRLIGFVHWFVFVGFFSLFLTLITAYGQVNSPAFTVPWIGNFIPYELFLELITWSTGIAILVLIVIRQISRFQKPPRKSRFYGSSMWQAYYVEATIVVIVICVLMLRGLEGAADGPIEWTWHYPLTFPLINAFRSLPVATIDTWMRTLATIKIVASMLWFIMIATNLTMGVAWHRFLAFFNIYFKRNANGALSLGELPPILTKGKPINFEDPADDDLFGIGKIEDMTWKGLLDLTTCTECGRCQSQCPAWNTDKPLSPKLLITALRDHAYAKAPYLLAVSDEARTGLPDNVKVEAERQLVGEGGVITPDILWSCTSCGACVQQCPVDIEHIDHIVNMRRHQVLVESDFPTELGSVFRNLETKGNPWGMNSASRNDWIKECDFPITVISGEIPADVEYLFWVGCAGAYEDRAKKTTKAVAELLNRAGVKFGVLGDGETCTGDAARRSGNEFLFQMLAAENVETLNAVFENRASKKVIVTCPHCFTTLGRDYKQLGISLELVHHTQLLNRLVRDKHLVPVAPINQTITYHDPCYLGRHNQVYTPPRELLEASGAELVEMPRNSERSFCCGAGGARMWMEEKLGERINMARVDEAIATKAQGVAVACPFCRVMVSDGAAGRSDEIEVLDVAQVLLKSLG